MRDLSLFAAAERQLRASLPAGLASFAAVAVLFAPTAGDAQQLLDHLKCYKIKDVKVVGDDGRQIEGLVDLTALQDPPFSFEPGCALKVKAKEFCIPVAKTPKQFNVPGTGVEGHDILDDFLCYKLRCPAPDDGGALPPDSLLVIDQFARREVRKFKTVKLCAPAVKIVDTTTTSTTTSTTSSTTTTLRSLCGPDGVCTAFVTGMAYRANLGDLAGADSICNQHASDAGLDGPFVAWLSTSLVDARDRLDPGSPAFYSPPGCAQLVATGVGDLTAGLLANPIVRDETCALRFTLVWTGTDADGTKHVGGCADWTDDLQAGSGLTGRSVYSDTRWTAFSTDDCSRGHNALYCFEQ